MIQPNYLNSPVVYKEFITQDTINDLYNFAITKFEQGWFTPDYWFHKNYRNDLPDDGLYRFLMQISNYDLVSTNSTLTTIYNKVVETMNLNSFNSFTADPLIGQIISINLPNSFTQKHTDSYNRNKHKLAPYYIGKRHIRFNIMVERGDHLSYRPFVMIEKNKHNPLDVNIGDAWCFPADQIVHFSPHIKGDKMRIVYQFGFAIDTQPKV